MNHDEDTNIEWDIEELKKAYLRNAEEYDKLMKIFCPYLLETG